MKKQPSFLLRALCLGMAVCMGICALPLSVAATADDAPAGSELVNKYNRRAPSNKIAVKPGDVIYYGPAICWSGTQYLTAYGANSSTTVVNPGVSTKVDSFGYYDIYSWTVPEGVTSVSVYQTRIYSNIFMVTVNQKLTKKNFNEYWEATNDTLLSASGKAFEPRTDLSLYGRSALFMGDSITHASRDDSTRYHSWAGRIGVVNSMDWVNAGVDGASVSSRKAAEKQLVTQMNDYLDRDFDYVIMWGGINDAWGNYAIGTVSESKNPADFDTDTFVGGLENLFYHAKNNYPDANHGYIITFPIVGLTEGNLAGWGDYVTEAIKVCEKWDVEYLDLYHDEEFCAKLKIGTTNTTYIADCVHPTGKGYDLIYPKIEAWMDSLDPLPPAPPTNPDNGSDTNNGGSTDNGATDDPIEAPADTTPAPADTEKGCGSSISGLTAVATTTLMGGAALCLKRKKKDEE